MRKIVLLLGCSLLTSPAISAATMYKVSGEDTVYGIAYAHGVPTHALISANNLKPPYVLKKGQEIQIPAPNEHILGKTETLQDIATHYGIDPTVLARENGLDPSSQITPGTHLMIPSRDTVSAVQTSRTPQAEPISSSSLAPLPAVKSIAPPVPNAPHGSSPQATLQPLPQAPNQGAKALLPEDLAAELALEKSQKAGVAPSKSAKTPLMGDLAKKDEPKKAITSKQTSPATTSSDENQKVVQAPEKKEDLKKEETKQVEKKESDPFIWPVQGKVIGHFSKEKKNDGINIKAPEGTPVKASADGEVMYAGSELKSFGNLVLLKHKDGWVTAYAHNSSLLVKKGDNVKQGQDIAKSGKTGDIKEAQVHFEIRKGKQPVDPLSKLKS